jgi:hypothetical protein
MKLNFIGLILIATILCTVACDSASNSLTTEPVHNNIVKQSYSLKFINNKEKVITQEITTENIDGSLTTTRNTTTIDPDGKETTTKETITEDAKPAFKQILIHKTSNKDTNGNIITTKDITITYINGKQTTKHETTINTKIPTKKKKQTTKKKKIEEDTTQWLTDHIGTATQKKTV